MDHRAIEENNVVERYLMGGLTTVEVASFEDHYLDCPECLDRLELSRRLHQGLREVAAEEGTKVLAASAFIAWLQGRGRSVQGLLTLVLLALFVLPWAYLAPQLSHLRGELDQALAPQLRSPAVELSPERSGPAAAPSVQITLTKRPEWVILALQLPPDPTPGRLRVSLSREGEEPLWRSRQLTADVRGQVMLSVHSTWLEATDYILDLEEEDAVVGSRAATRFSFRIRRNE